MSNTGERLIEYEEQNWTELAEEFIEMNYSKAKVSWEDFVMKKFESHEADKDWEPDYEHEE